MFAAISLALLASLISSHAQEFNLNNYCDKNLYFWEVGSNPRPPVLIPLNDYIQILFEPDPITKGKDIFISHSNTSDLSQPTLHFSYNVVGDWSAKGHVLWYSMANINGVPFKGHDVRIDGPPCPKILWKDGQGDDGVKNCRDAQFMDLRLCVEMLES
ncbi:hypothetical protein CC80DRAFT_593025 [Byssothecium circinans]|uniref:BYS1 domain protein n=1 Tax=Byssothecium circinans TaxID=147558 RepID=A0A6A5TX51_9PLEO|nr:hypothetical protein CC80DRAFT_593025 [Byssothecium circinans]